MKLNIMRIQAFLIFAVIATVIAIFILYLGFMTQYYVLFYDGTFEMFEYYKQLQVFNKEAFNIALIFLVFAALLSTFRLQSYRPGLAGLILVIITTIYLSMRSLSLISVLPKYKNNYLKLEFAELEDYTPTTFVFDAGVYLHYLLIGLLVLLTIVACITFFQRLKEGNPLIRRLA